MHLRGMRAGLAQNLRLFLCMDLGIMRGVLCWWVLLLASLVAGGLGCWWVSGRLAVNTMIVILFCYLIFVLHYIISYIYIMRLARNRFFLARILAQTCALLHFGERPELCTAALYNFSFKDL